MFSTQLPTPSPDDLRAFQHNPEAIRAAVAVKADLPTTSPRTRRRWMIAMRP